QLKLNLSLKNMYIRLMLIIKHFYFPLTLFEPTFKIQLIISYIYSYNLGNMVHKFLPNYRKWFDYERSSAFCVRSIKLYFLLYVKPWDYPGFFVLYNEEESTCKKKS